MRRYSFTQTELYTLILFIAVIAALAVLLGFNIAWQFNQSTAKAPLVLSHQIESEQLAVTSNVPNSDSDAQTYLSYEGLTSTEVFGAVPAINSVSVADDAPLLKSDSGFSQANKAEAFVTEGATGFSLQLAAFSEKKRAIASAKNHRDAYEDLRVLVREVDGKQYFSVVVGQFPTKSAAKLMQRNMMSNTGISSYVIQRDGAQREINLSS
ncbi:MAG: SPOR domain-containing protein [Oleiphilaceae bacterium]|nr:SPOR domain-containing protein [Oleiphilaceae bacterium]